MFDKKLTNTIKNIKFAFEQSDNEIINNIRDDIVHKIHINNELHIINKKTQNIKNLNYNYNYNYNYSDNLKYNEIHKKYKEIISNIKTPICDIVNNIINVLNDKSNSYVTIIKYDLKLNLKFGSMRSLFLKMPFLFYSLFFVSTKVINNFDIFLTHKLSKMYVDYIFDAINLYFPELKITYMSVEFKNIKYKCNFSSGYIIYNDSTYEKNKVLMDELKINPKLSHKEYNQICGVEVIYCESKYYYKYDVYIIFDDDINNNKCKIYNFVSENQIDEDKFIQPFNENIIHLNNEINVPSKVVIKKTLVEN